MKVLDHLVKIFYTFTSPYIHNIVLFIYIFISGKLLLRPYPEDMSPLHVTHEEHYHGLPHTLISKSYEGITYIIPSDEMMPAIVLAIVLILNILTGDSRQRLLSIKNINRWLWCLTALQLAIYYYVV